MEKYWHILYEAINLERSVGRGFIVKPIACVRIRDPTDYSRLKLIKRFSFLEKLLRLKPMGLKVLKLIL